MGIQARVIHKDHDGNIVSMHQPIGGSLSWSFKANEIGDITYQIAYDDQALNTFTRPANTSLFVPYIEDYELQINYENSGWTTVAAGIITSVNMVDETDFVSVNGKDWAHWLEQPVWFPPYKEQFSSSQLFKGTFQGPSHGTKSFKNSLAFAAYGARNGVPDSRKNAGDLNGFAALPDGYPLIYAWWPGTGSGNLGTQENFLKFMINNAKTASLTGADNLPARLTGEYVNITGDFGGPDLDSWNLMTPYFINFQDETNILDHINNIASADDPLGFDWTMQADKTMSFFASRKSLASSPDPIWFINKTMFIGENPTEGIDWTNNGPISTRVIGLGVGSPALWWVRSDVQSTALYRDWLKLERVTTLHQPQGGDALQDLLQQIQTKTAGLNYLHQQKDAKVSVDPALVDALGPGGFLNQVGNTINITWDFEPYHKISAYYWITSQEYSTDEAGEYKLQLGLQQIYE